MAAIYSSCFLVIGASRAINCNEGFLHHRVGSYYVGTYQFSHMDFEVHAREEISHGWNSSGLEDMIFETPLFKRGW
jgi:hypothetical protein